jgi:hypothetical protein
MGPRYPIPASGVLPAELLTVVQVMLMSQCPGVHEGILVPPIYGNFHKETDDKPR